MRDLLSLNIVFIPPKAISDDSIKISQQISDKYETEFILDDSNCFPHITIYQLIIPKQNVSVLVEELDRLTSHLNHLKLEFNKINFRNGFIDIELKLVEELLNTQKSIIEKVNPLREGEKVSEFWEKQFKSRNYAPAQIKNISKYGHPDILDFYRPHLTLTCLKDKDKDSEVARDLKWETSILDCNEIGLYKMGEFGTCNKLVKQFKLRTV